jgi:N-acetylmuramoyl-L-alanine amidase
MKTGTRILQRIAIAASLACVLLPSVQARTVKQKKQAARTQFENAERMREALDGRPESQRSRRDYLKVIEAYRKVYYTAPTSNKADTAVLAVAELLDEQGRILNDPKSYKDAIGQLVFLRREYPGSKYRVEALFTIGEIYRDDLGDNPGAKATFEDYLKRYPHTSLAAKARQALAEISDPQAANNPFRRKDATAKSGASRTGSSSSGGSGAKTKTAWADSRSSAPGNDESVPEKPARATSSPDKISSGSTSNRASAVPADATSKTSARGDDDILSAAPPAAPGQQVDAALGKTDTQPHHLPRLTSVRHWSTPDYTRVAIDLEQEVEYQVGRVPHPDRIFFDLVGTKLASDLVGKSFDVEAGFLHRIRVAQYKANVARVVLDVDDVAEYSAFLLPNPYRLIIDIHGKLPPQQTASARPPAKPPVTAQPHTPQATTAAGPSRPSSSNPDVTPIKPSAGAQSAPSAAAVIEQAEKTKSGPLKGASIDKDSEAKDSNPRPSDAASNSNDVIAPDKTVIVPRSGPSKTVADDTTIDETARLTSKPTTAPTFQSIAPQESSRRTKTTKTTNPAKPQDVTPVVNGHVASPTASGDRSLIRALGLKIGKIVVDAGHGGHDTGTIGPNGLMEKDLVLDVALKLGKLLETRLGAEVVYTRDDDTFIPLETRTAIANKEQADMFISIHANSSGDPAARGVETYYLNFTSAPDALEVAARENAVSEKSIHELQDLVKKIALKEKIEESREFAADVQHSLYAGLSAKNAGIRNRGVKKAPFVVLIGANMPSILAEISFVSNPTDAKKLKTSEYRQRIAESLYKGINKYVSGLSGVKVASKVEDLESTKGTAAVAAAK